MSLNDAHLRNVHMHRAMEREDEASTLPTYEHSSRSLSQERMVRMKLCLSTLVVLDTKVSLCYSIATSSLSDETSSSGLICSVLGPFDKLNTLSLSLIHI